MFSDVLRAAEPRDSTDAGRSACGEQPHPNRSAKSRVRIPHRVSACVLPLRLRPLRLVARPVWAAEYGSVMASHNPRISRLDTRNKSFDSTVREFPCTAAHTGRRKTEERPEGERRSEGRGFRCGMRTRDFASRSGRGGTPRPGRLAAVESRLHRSKNV